MLILARLQVLFVARFELKFIVGTKTLVRTEYEISRG
jgi:hypothetical protein